MFDALLLVWFLATASLFVVSFQSQRDFRPWQRSVAKISGGLYVLFAFSCLLLAPELWKIYFITGVFYALNVLRYLKLRADYRLLRGKIVSSFWKLGLVDVILFILIVQVAEGALAVSDTIASGFMVLIILASIVALRMIAATNPWFSGLPRKTTNRDEELPSVSILIPARNEDHALEACLNTLLDIDYPKLEILVLDDCSQDQTSEVIARFAHAGVRFIKGVSPDDSWLGRNYAMHQLQKVASGEILVFTEVDIRFSSRSITQIARAFQNTKYSMLSITPQKYATDFPSSWLYPLAEIWDVAAPFGIRGFAPVSHSMMVIRSSELARLGGFSKLRKHVNPFRYFANQLRRWRSYRYVQSDERLGLYMRKRMNSVLESGARRAYPQIGSDPSHVLLVVALLLGLLVLIGAALLSPVYTPSLLLLVIPVASHQMWVLKSSNLLVRVTRAIGVVFLPINIALEIYAQLLSMINYEFRKVVWKERLVCYPIYKEFSKTS